MFSLNIINEAINESKSITHKHILSIINTRINGRFNGDIIRILDAGCGNCELIAYLQKFVSKFNDELTIEVYGFDVFDSKVQFNDYYYKANLMLSDRFSHIDWQSRLKIISSNEAWPFEDKYFDIVLSNQVLEHINNHEFFLVQNWRVLKNQGFSIHLFPVKNYVVEGHIHLPFVHRIKRWSLLYRFIKFLSFLRMGKWKYISKYCTLNEFAESYADFLTYYCNYLSVGDLIELGKKCKFRTGFKYTRNFYLEKIKEIFKIKHQFLYDSDRYHTFSIHFFKYIQCITLFLEKFDSYDNYIARYYYGEKDSD